ncbi:hypothetical protein BC830DRAFT_1094254 [Chytriomyces sp. MP71]|nr:hypothetical protein BC830DRAFT_1094254 [Chytriomyces sp. MP71]
MLLTLLATASAASALNINGFSYTGNVSADGNTATICINGSVAQNTYIGFGVAKSAGTMSGADLTIAFADATGAVKVLHGSGSSAPAFVQDATSPLTTATNSYTNGVLNVCFSRPLAGSGSVLPLSATASGK